MSNLPPSAEIKHGRLAMLAALGWPVAELLQPIISSALNQPDLLVSDAAGVPAERVPSLLNGGLDQISPAFFAVGIDVIAHRRPAQRDGFAQHFL